MMIAELASKDLEKLLIDDLRSESTLFSDGGQSNSNFTSDNFEQSSPKQSDEGSIVQAQGAMHELVTSM